jgi:hypothetical protein
MTTKRHHLTIKFTQGEGAITVSACIPEEHIKTCGRIVSGIIGGGVIWATSHLTLNPIFQVNSPNIQAPPSTQVNSPSTAHGK